MMAVFSRSAGSTVVMGYVSDAGAFFPLVAFKTHTHRWTSNADPNSNISMMSYLSLSAATAAYVKPTGAIAVAVNATRANPLSIDHHPSLPSQKLLHQGFLLGAEFGDVGGDSCNISLRPLNHRRYPSLLFNRW